MPYSITCSTKIFTLETAPLLFILVGVHSEFAMAKCVHLTVPSGRKGAIFFLKAQMYTFSSTLIKKM